MSDLNFDGQNTLYATHGLHSYAAKCPPQLARFGIINYSHPGETILDPMSGSGTTLVEARLLGRNAIGYDLDPLACLISQVKCRVILDSDIEAAYNKLMKKSIEDLDERNSNLVQSGPIKLPDFLNRDYWFSPSVATALAVLSSNISLLESPEEIRDFFWVAFSSIILTKVSVANARDIIHSRHHYFQHPAPPNVFLKFKDKVRKMRRQMLQFADLCKDLPCLNITVDQCDARRLPLPDQSIDLVFTSPPYATALDYPRAHFLAVGWMQARLGVNVEQYKTHGAAYVGSERGRVNHEELLSADFSSLSQTQSTLLELEKTKSRQATLIHRYFTDMDKVFGEIGRVLKNESYAVIVVCPSHIRKSRFRPTRCLPRSLRHIISILSKSTHASLLGINEFSLTCKRLMAIG